jgi:hypothetical protein
LPFLPAIALALHKIENMLTPKQRFLNMLAEQFRNTATWRQVRASKYAHDYRNADAAARLRELEYQIEISDDVWKEIEHLVSSHRAALGAMSDTNREVGFKKFPRDFEAWFENFMTRLTMHSSVAA